MADDADAPDRQLNTITESASGDPPPPAGSGDDLDDDVGDDNAPTEVVTQDPAAPARRAAGVRLAVAVGLVVIAAVGAVAAWLCTQAYQSHRQAQERALFLSVGRQGALNLTTIRASDVDSDVQRILDSSTGAFHDDFQKRSEPFVGLVKQTQSASKGTVTEAGVESASDDQAQILVAVSVKTATAGGPEQQPRLWRMRLNVQKVDGGAKVSDVAFVP
jgi:Mce-associated membrane protein